MTVPPPPVPRESVRLDQLAPLKELRKRVSIAFGVLMGVTMVGTLGYVSLGGGEWSVFDGFYMTVITVSTVGYGEVLPGMDSMPGAREWSVMLIMAGSGTVVFFISSVTAFIVEGDVGGALRRRSMQKQIDQLSGHAIVVGAGATGVKVLQELAAVGRRFVVIETREERLKRALYSFPAGLGLHGDGTDDEVLIAAGIERASALAATMPNDRDNLFVTVSARALNSKLRIVTRVVDDTAAAKMRRGGANATVSPAHIGGMRLASEMVRPHVVQFIDQMLSVDEALRLEEVSLDDESPLVGASLGGTNLRGATRALLVAVREQGGKFSYNPPDDLTLASGTTLVLLASVDDFVRFKAALKSGEIRKL